MSRKKLGRETGRGRGAAVYSRPEVYASVYCVGTTDKPHPKWRIASFHPEIHNGDLVWHAFNGSYYEPETTRAVHVAGGVSQWLEGDRWVSHTDHAPDVFQSEQFRVRWNLRCRECGMSRAVADPSAMYDAFTALAQLQIPEIELIHLVHAQRHADD